MCIIRQSVYTARNFVTKGTYIDFDYSSGIRYHFFAPLKENIGGHKFKDDRDVEAVATRRLITRARGLQCKQGIAKPVPPCDVSVVEGSTWQRYCVLTVRFTPNRSHALYFLTDPNVYIYRRVCTRMYYGCYVGMYVCER